MTAVTVVQSGHVCPLPRRGQMTRAIYRKTYVLMAKRPTSLRSSRSITPQAAPRVVLPRLPESSLSSLVMSNQKEMVTNPLTLIPVKSQRMESLTTSSKPSLLSGERPRVGILLLVKRARANVPSPSREPDRGRNLEPNLRKRVLRPVRRRPRPTLPIPDLTNGGEIGCRPGSRRGNS